MSSNTRIHRHRWLAGLSAAAVVVSGAAMLPGSAEAFGPSRSHIDRTQHPKLVQPASEHSTTSYAPRSVSAIPKSGDYAFWVTLKTTSTGAAFRLHRSSGLAAARSAAREQLSTVTAAQQALISRLPDRTPVLYRTHATLAGVAVRTDVRNLGLLKSLPNVAHVYPITPKTPGTSYAIPLQGAPAAWEGMGDRGANTVVAIIDTGIDYTHADFGGPGTPQAYDTAHATEAAPADPSLFPSSKIIGGTDLVGDAYNANNPASVPQPDSNPLDCNGHGSHVAGIAAGEGVNADGSTYTGAYNTSTPFGSMKIGPGMAPRAKLFAIRVFGCTGSTNVVTEAIDYAMDPNGDGDTSDHVDVANMSLGSPYGDPQDADAVASDIASQAGIVMAISAGNDDDVTDAGGSPGTAVRAITSASSVDASNVVDGMNTTFDGAAQPSMPITRAVLYNWNTQPDLAGTVAVLPNTSTTSTPNDTACSTLDSTQIAAIQGKVALVRWTDGAGLECGSIGRGARLRAAGAVGFIFANTQPGIWGAGINGDTVIPGVLTDKTSGDSIRSAIAGGQTVVVTGTVVNASNVMLPQDDNKVSSFSSRGYHSQAGAAKPDVAAVGNTVFSAAVGSGFDGVSESGTSMASPMTAGLAALVRATHPEWSVEQVKADIMNTAGQDVYVNGSQAGGTMYAPIRVGAGRIKADWAVANTTLAYVGDGSGAVSASFGAVEASGPTTLTKAIKVQNTSLSTVSYDVAYDAITSVAGVDYSVSPSSVTVAPRSSQTVTVTLSIPDISVLNNTVDPSVGRVDPATGLRRETLAEAQGRVLLTPAGSTSGPQLRVPVYSAPRPAATMTQGAVNLDATGHGLLGLTGGDLGQSDPTSNGGSTSSTTDDIYSFAAGFELTAKSDAQSQCASPTDIACWNLPWEKAGDVKYVGVTSDAQLPTAVPMAYFAIVNRVPVSVPTSKVYYQVDIDTTGDHLPDYVLYNDRLGTGDVYVSNLVNLATGKSIDLEYTDGLGGRYNKAIYDSDSIVLPLYLPITDGGFDNAGNPVGNPVFDPNQRINYGISTWSTASPQPLDLVGEDSDGNVSMSADLFHPAVTVDEGGYVMPVDDANGLQLDVNRNAGSFAGDHGLGLLMVHFHNANGNKGQEVALKKPAPGSTSLSVSPNPAARGQNVTMNVSVAPASGQPVPTGTVTVKDNTGAVVGTGALNGTGSATFTHAWSVAGSYQLTASYSGDGNYDPSTSAPVALTVAKSKSAQSLKFKPRRGVKGQVSKAIVRVATVAGIPATGQVKLKVGSKTVGKAKLVNGKAVIKFTPHKSGKLKVTAAYAGDVNYTRSSTVKYYTVR